MSGHAATPFFCPYCGEEDIRPFGERHGEWVCGSCRRAWALRGVVAREPAPGSGPDARAVGVPKTEGVT
jgi:ribosomal protein L37AE/L43A